jgi:hypothetical protein
MPQNSWLAGLKVEELDRDGGEMMKKLNAE